MRHFFLASLALLAAVPVAAHATGSDAAEPFVASRDAGMRERSLECLTQAIYYEARSESEGGQRAVAQVVLNRVRHPAFPNSVCGVVFQGSTRSTGCQFSFTCMGAMGRIGEPAAWDRAQRIAAEALSGRVYRPVGLATNYHTTAIRPYWAPSLVRQTVIGAHIFYRLPNGGSVQAFSQAPSDFEPDGSPRSYIAVARNEGLVSEGMQPSRSSRGRPDRYQAYAVSEIPVVERQLIYRTLGPRPLLGRATAAAASARRAATIAVPRAAVLRRGPRVTVEGGIRIIRGS